VKMLDLFNNTLQLFKFGDETFIQDGKKMWVYDGFTIKEVEFKPTIKEGE